MILDLKIRRVAGETVARRGAGPQSGRACALRQFDCFFPALPVIMMMAHLLCNY